MSADKETFEPTKSPKELHTQWIAWLRENDPKKQAKYVDIRDRRKDRNELSFNNQYRQANLYLRRGDYDVLSLERMVQSHPMLAIGSMKRLTNKVNPKAPKKKHESAYDIRFSTVFGWRVTMGYSRFGDAEGTTHLWCKFGFNCWLEWQHKMMVDLMLHFAGFESVYGYPHGSHWRPKLESGSRVNLKRPRWVPKPQPPPPPTPPPSQPLAQEEAEAPASQPLARQPEEQQEDMESGTQEEEVDLEQGVCMESGTQEEEDVQEEEEVQEQREDAESCTLEEEEREAAKEADPLQDAMGRHPSLWTVAEVVLFFQDLKLMEYVENLVQDGVDGETLIEMSREDWIMELGMSDHEVEYLANAIKSLPHSANTLPAIGGRGPRVIHWAEQEEMDSDVAEDDDNKVEVGGEEDTKDLHAEDAEASEAEELQYMARVREQRRQHPAQRKFRPQNFYKSKFSPVPWRSRAIDPSDAAIGAIHPFALDMVQAIGVDELVMTYPHINPSKQERVDFLRMHGLHAIDYRHAICHRRQITAPTSAIGGYHNDFESSLDPMPFSAELWKKLPSTDGVGDEIEAQEFADRWDMDGENLLFHLMKSCEGQLKEVEGTWELLDTAIGVPKMLFHPQFAISEFQERACAEFGPAYVSRNRGKGKGKGQNKGRGKDKGKYQGDEDENVNLTHAAVIGANHAVRPVGHQWADARNHFAAVVL